MKTTIKTISFVAVLAVAFCSFTAAFADAETVNQIADFGEFNSAQSQERYQKFIASVNEIAGDSSKDKAFQNSAQTEEVNLINLQYDLLKEQMKQEGFGKAGDLKIPDSDEGYAKALAAKFQESYGAIMSSLGTDNLKLPEDFDVSAMTNQFSSMRKKAFKGYTDNIAYQDATHKIGLSSSFEIAGNPMELPNMGSLSEFKTELARDIKKTTDSRGKNALNVADIDTDKVSEEFFKREETENKQWVDTKELYNQYEDIVNTEKKREIAEAKRDAAIKANSNTGISPFEYQYNLQQIQEAEKELADTPSWFDTDPFYQQLKEKLGG